MASGDKHVFLQCCSILEGLYILHKGKGTERNFLFAGLLLVLLIWKIVSSHQSEDYLLRILTGVWKVTPIKDRIYRCALLLRLLDICLDKLQVIIVAKGRTHPNRLGMKGQKYAQSNDRSLSHHILAWSNYKKFLKV